MLKSIVLALALFSGSYEGLESRADFSGITDSNYVVTKDYGGLITDYLDKYTAIEEAGGTVEIHDFCLSACTLVLGLVDNICVRPRAIFGFHSASQQTIMGPVFSQEGTDLLWNLYPENVKEKLRALGWNGDEHPALVYIKGTELAPLCK